MIYWDKTNPEIMNNYMDYFDDWLNLPRGTMRGIAISESSYNPATGEFRNGCNWLRACGMFQLRPIMLRDIEQRFGYKLDPLDPFQALVAAALAMQLNKRYLRYYAGTEPDLFALIAAYNGGFGAGLRYMRGLSIPYETRNYIAKVWNNIYA